MSTYIAQGARKVNYVKQQEAPADSPPLVLRAHLYMTQYIQ